MDKYRFNNDSEIWCDCGRLIQDHYEINPPSPEPDESYVVDVICPHCLLKKLLKEFNLLV